MASAVAKLRTRIEGISLSIARQKEILQDLEKQKSAAQGELNAILDPMSRMPLEISSDIFTRCLSTSPTFLPRDAPSLFLNVCRAWRNIALGTPSLWAAINDEGIQVAELPKLVEAWISRARTFPLSLSLHGSLLAWPHNGTSNRNYEAPAGVPAPVGAMVKQHAHQIQNLELCVPCEEELEAMTFAFTSLRSFQYPDGNSTAVILRNLTLPALRTLFLSQLDITPTDFLSFLTRSSPPLQSLRVRLGRVTDSHDIQQYLRLLPGLTDLDIERPIRPIRFRLPLLLRTVADLLPNLRSLTVRDDIAWDREDYQGVLDVLTSHRTSLESFRIIVHGNGSGNRPPDDIVVALRQLVEDGMHIHIGTKEQNEIDL
ncbi:hypothetical protein DFH07DRAFT_1063241 [Mycena maculata]|uniref:F-box domain-containing protein n=1 Tax=Mycena maculata TaxID=230809 RepID=A0AAD7N4H6_9AGAR|nr:hypothetical protein DFH07DRAFT_1063241 [Mycena maculata]